MLCSLRAAWVFPVAAPPIAGGWVTVLNGSIVAVGNSPQPGAAQRDLGNVALLPGLINAHAHLEFSLLHSPLGAPGQSLPQWIGEVLAYRRAGFDRRAALSAGVAESARHGVAAIGEIATADWTLPDYRQACAPSPTMQLLLFHELIGFLPEVASDRAHEAASRLGTTDETSDENLRPGLSPHAPYTVSPELLRELVRLAVLQHTPLAMHLAESPEELELLATGGGPFRDLLQAAGVWRPDVIPPGTRPLDYLQALLMASNGSCAPQVLAVHGNFLNQEEIEFAAQHRDRLSVVYCPRTHAYFGHNTYPLLAMRKAGVRVVLGTDGRCSNPDLNLVQEMRHVAAHFPVPPSEALHMVTQAAAEAVGWSSTLGTITPGKRAVFCALDLSPSPPSPQDPHEALLHSAASSQLFVP